MVSFQTTHTEDYLAIKSQLKSLGFKFIKTEKHEIDAESKNVVWMEYQKGNLKLSLISGNNQHTNNKAVYEISITKEINK